jgi:hypothetical protein
MVLISSDQKLLFTVKQSFLLYTFSLIKLKTQGHKISSALQFI